MTVPFPICRYCSRFRDFDPPRCEAFPRRIPDLIFFDAGDHRTRLQDEELVFEARDAEAAAAVRRFWGPRPRKPKAVPRPRGLAL